MGVGRAGARGSQSLAQRQWSPVICQNPLAAGPRSEACPNSCMDSASTAAIRAEGGNPPSHLANSESGAAFHYHLESVI